MQSPEGEKVQIVNKLCGEDKGQTCTCSLIKQTRHDTRDCERGCSSHTSLPRLVQRFRFWTGQRWQKATWLRFRCPDRRLRIWLGNLQPITLRALLKAAKQKPPPLGDRFRLAFALASVFGLFHATGWLHKGSNTRVLMDRYPPHMGRCKILSVHITIIPIPPTDLPNVLTSTALELCSGRSRDGKSSPMLLAQRTKINFQILAWRRHAFQGNRWIN